MVIDGAQRAPDLVPVLRVIVDEDLRCARLLVLGSASPDLVGLTSESLAGWVTLIGLSGLSSAASQMCPCHRSRIAKHTPKPPRPSPSRKARGQGSARSASVTMWRGRESIGRPMATPAASSASTSSVS